MRRTLAIICFLAGLALAPLTIHAQGSDVAQEQFVAGFLLVKKAEEQANTNDLRTALTNYRAAADIYSRLKQQFPGWQSELVDYRLKRTNEAIAGLQNRMGGAPAVEPGLPPGEEPGVLPPIDPGVPPLEPEPERAPKPPKTSKTSKPMPVPSDPIAAVQQRISTLESQLEEATERLTAEQKKNEDLAKELTSAVQARRDAEVAQKKAQDLMELNQKNLLDLKGKGDMNSDKVKTLEAELAEVKKKNGQMEADLIAAEERLTQLVERSRTMTAKANEAGDLPEKIKALESKLTAEAAAKADLSTKLTGMTKERDDARLEIVRLKDMNKQVDKLMADNANLLKKLGDAEKQIFEFKSDAPQKDREIAMLKKQVTDAQKALTSSEGKNTELQTQIADLQKQVGDYTKQIQQFKADKTASADEQRRMEEENKLLQGIVMRVLQEDANRSQRKKMLQKELDRLAVDSDVLLKQIDYLTQPVVKLSAAERRLFKKPVIEVQDPNTLAIIKPEGDAPASTEPAAEPGTPPPAVAKVETNPLKPELPGAEPLPEPAPAATTDPEKMAKIETLPDSPASTVPNVPADPEKAAADATTIRTLPEEVKPLAERAKLAFEQENFVEAEKLYDKALQAAPNNLYLISNQGVVQFRAGKFKQAEESFRKALAIAPEDHFCWGTLGIVEYSQGQYDEAVNALTKSLAINPKNATAHNYLGITAAQKGWLDAAQKELETAIQLDEDYADAWFNLAVVHTLRAPVKKDEAAKAYKKAVAFGAAPDPSMESLLKE